MQEHTVQRLHILHRHKHVAGESEAAKKISAFSQHKLIFLIGRGRLPDQSILNNHLPFRFAGYEILKRVVRHHHGCGSGSQFQDEAVVAGGGQRMGARADAAMARNRNDTTLLTELATT